MAPLSHIKLKKSLMHIKHISGYGTITKYTKIKVQKTKYKQVHNCQS